MFKEHKTKNNYENNIFKLNLIGFLNIFCPKQKYPRVPMFDAVATTVAEKLVSHTTSFQYSTE